MIVLDAAADLLRQSGWALALESLTYARVFQHLKDTQDVTVTRGSVHERIWSDIDAFRMDALVHSASELSDAGFETVAPLLTGLLESTDLSTLAGREAALRTLAVDGMRAFYDVTGGSVFDRWRMVACEVLSGPLADHDDAGNTLRAQIVRNDEARTERFYRFFVSFIEPLRLQVRPEFNLSTDEALKRIITMAGDLADGLHLFEKGSGVSRPGIERVAPATGDSEEWLPYGLALHAFVSYFFYLADDE